MSSSNLPLLRVLLILAPVVITVAVRSILPPSPSLRPPLQSSLIIPNIPQEVICESGSLSIHFLLGDTKSNHLVVMHRGREVSVGITSSPRCMEESVRSILNGLDPLHYVESAARTHGLNLTVGQGNKMAGSLCFYDAIVYWYALSHGFDTVSVAGMRLSDDDRDVPLEYPVARDYIRGAIAVSPTKCTMIPPGSPCQRYEINRLACPWGTVCGVGIDHKLFCAGKPLSDGNYRNVSGSIALSSVCHLSTQGNVIYIVLKEKVEEKGLTIANVLLRRETVDPAVLFSRNSYPMVVQNCDSTCYGDTDRFNRLMSNLMAQHSSGRTHGSVRLVGSGIVVIWWDSTDSANQIATIRMASGQLVDLSLDMFDTVDTRLTHGCFVFSHKSKHVFIKMSPCTFLGEERACGSEGFCLKNLAASTVSPLKEQYRCECNVFTETKREYKPNSGGKYFNYCKPQIDPCEKAMIKMGEKSPCGDNHVCASTGKNDDGYSCVPRLGCMNQAWHAGDSRKTFCIPPVLHDLTDYEYRMVNPKARSCTPMTKPPSSNTGAIMVRCIDHKATSTCNEYACVVLTRAPWYRVGPSSSYRVDDQDKDKIRKVTALWQYLDFLTDKGSSSVTVKPPYVVTLGDTNLLNPCRYVYGTRGHLSSISVYFHGLYTTRGNGTLETNLIIPPTQHHIAATCAPISSANTPTVAKMLFFISLCIILFTLSFEQFDVLYLSCR